jgi:hypothetical protein
LNIGILTSTNPQLRQLGAEGLADAKAQATESEAEVVPVAQAKPRPTGNTAPSAKFASLRAALDARIAADVSAGQLSSTDAAAVGATLDAIDNRSGQPQATSTAAFLAGRAIYSVPSSDSQPAQAARDYLATIGRGTLIDRWA